jgi:hypothetical protein
MQIKSAIKYAAVLTVLAASQLQAQRVIDLTSDLLDRFLKGADAEQVELGSSGDQLKALDEKLKAFRECQKNFLGSQNSGGKLGLAAKLALKAKCGATDEDGIVKERNKITEGPAKAGAKVAGMKENDYLALKEKLTAYAQGDRNGFCRVVAARAVAACPARGRPIMPGSTSLSSSRSSTRRAPRCSRKITSRVSGRSGA